MPALTQVSLQPLVSLDELVNQGKVMGVGLVRHHPSACRNLQLPVSHQPKDEAHLGWGRDGQPEDGGDCTW